MNRLRSAIVILIFASRLTPMLAQTSVPQDSTPQFVNSAITGAVTDKTGVPIAGAKVTAVDSSGKAHEATTDDQGLYAIMDVPAGKYTITVTAQGQEIYKGDIQLNAGEVQTLNISPQPPPEPAAPAATPGPSIFMPSQPAIPAPPPGAVKGAASISGSVTDQTGASVVGAKIELLDAAGKQVQSTVTDEKGNYTLKGVLPGSYKLSVSAPLFKTFETTGLTVRGSESVPVDAALEPAGEKTEVNVEGAKVSQVETETSQVSGTITEKEVLTLGLNGRNFTQLIALTPGVSNQTGQDEAHVGVTGSVKYSVNGGRVEYNTFEVDGGDVLNAGLNGAESTLMVYPSLDAIQEVKVLTSNYGAMYGRTASGTVLVTTKSGTPQWHGSAYEFLRNEFFNARNYFDQTKKAPLYRRNDFGFTIGGPLFIPGVYNLRKEKTFVFWSEEFRYEKSPTDQQPNFNHAVPSLAERLGDFNDVCPQNASTFSRSLFPDCPSAGPSSSAGLLQTFPQNIVSAVPDVNGALDPNALAFLNTNLIPLPNSATGCNSTIDSCYNAVISEPTYWREELFRLDHNLTSKLHLSLRYIHDAWHTTVPVPQWGFIKNSFPTVQNKFVGPGISVVAKLTDTITPSLLNDFTATYANSDITLENVNGPGGADFSRPPQLSQPGGTCQDLINNVGGNTLILPSCPMGTLFNNGFGGKAPGLLIGGTNQAYGGSGFAVDPAYMPWSHTNPTYSVRDDVSIAIGKHTLQFGAQYILSQRNELNGAIGAASGDIQGLLTFSNINGGDGNTGNAFANFLTLLNRGSGASFGINAIQSFTQDSTQQRYHNSYHIVEPYVQDDWRVNSRLTVNLGLRFSIFSLFQEKDKRAYNWDPKAYDPAVATQLVVDPNTGQLLSATQGGPIPLNPNSPDPRLLNGIVQCGVNGVPRGCMKGHLFNPAPRIGFALDPRGNGKTSIRAGYGIFFEHGTPEEANTGSLEGSAPLVLSVTQRFPANYGCIGGTQPTCMVSPGAYPLDVTAIPTKAIWPYAQQWSLSVQQELPASMVATVAYVGSKGTHLTVERQLNQLRPLPEGANPFGVHQPLIPQAIVGNGGDCGGFVAPQPGVAPGFFLLNGTVVGPESPAYVSLIAACAGANSLPETPTPDVNTLRRYPGFGQIFSLQNVADSSYHALQATVRRSRGPLTVGVSYSYSHSFDDASDRSDTTLVDSFDLHSNRASSNFDQRHLLSVSYIYSLPGKKLIDAWQRWINSDGSADSSVPPPPASRLTQALLDGWQISGITTFTSGTPFSVINGGSSTISVLDNAGVANGIGAGSYPDLAPGPTGGKPQGGNNPKSFGPLLGDPNRFVAPRGLTFGNAGRNYLNNPGRLNFDMSLLKHFSITESSVLELRAEAFNIFNHTQFRIYNPDLGNTGSNVISCYGGSDYRAGYSVPGGVDCLTGSSFLHPVDAHRPRTVQLGLKYTF